MNYLQQQALDVLASTQDMKRHYWEEHGQRDMMPVFAYIAEGEEVGGQVPPFWVEKALALTDDLSTCTYHVFAAAHGSVEFRSIIVIADAYTSVGETIPERGSLGEDFKSNPASNVVETLVVMMATKDLVGGCDLATAMSRYRITDGGAIIFDEPEVKDGSDVMGRVADTLRVLFTEQEAS